MAETLESKVKDILRNYVREVKSLPNESAKRSRFASLIAELFPGSTAINDYARGVEKLIRIGHSSGVKKGRADAYYGNAIIEFEKSLTATLEEAKHQLCEYVAGTWQKEKSGIPMLAVASDGIRWVVYRPVLPAGEEPTTENILLDELRDFSVAEDTLGTFWLWLTSFLFRPQQVEPTAERFQLDFGSWSPLYREGMASLKRAWSTVSGTSEAKLAFETWQRYLTVTYGSLTEDTTVAKDPDDLLFRVTALLHTPSPRSDYERTPTLIGRVFREQVTDGPVIPFVSGVLRSSPPLSLEQPPERHPVLPGCRGDSRPTSFRHSNKAERSPCAFFSPHLSTHPKRYIPRRIKVT